jgi:hypothetical protein
MSKKDLSFAKEVQEYEKIRYESFIHELYARIPFGVEALVTTTNGIGRYKKLTGKEVDSFINGTPIVGDYGLGDNKYCEVIVTDIKLCLYPWTKLPPKVRDILEDLISRKEKNPGSIGALNLLKLECISSSALIRTCYENHIDFDGLLDTEYISGVPFKKILAIEKIT